MQLIFQTISFCFAVIIRSSNILFDEEIDILYLKDVEFGESFDDMKIICRLLDVLSILFLADEDSVGTYSHYYVLESVYIDVVLEFVYDAGLITVLTYDDIDDDVNLELVSGVISDAALS